MKEKYRKLAENGISSERLILRKFKYSDLEDYYDFSKCRDIANMAGWKAHTDINESMRKIRNILNETNKASFVIADKETDEFIGTISFMPDERKKLKDALELGYSIKKECQGNGYAKEAVCALIKELFLYYGTEEITAYCFLDNVKSINLLKEIGFTEEKIYKKTYKTYNGKLRDEQSFSLNNTDFQRMFHVEHS